MKKILKLVALMIMSSVIFTGCFGVSDKEKVEQKVESYIKKNNSGDISLLGKQDTISEKITIFSTYLSCMKNKKKEIKDFYIKLDKENKEFGRLITKKQEEIGKDKFKELDKKLMIAAKNKDKEQFQKLLKDFKDKYGDKFGDDKMVKVLFEEEVLNASNPREYFFGAVYNAAIQNFGKPLSQKFPKESKECVMKVLNEKPIKKIEKIEISKDKKTATVIIDFEDNTTKEMKLEKKNKKWEFK